MLFINTFFYMCLTFLELFILILIAVVTFEAIKELFEKTENTILDAILNYITFTFTIIAGVVILHTNSYVVTGIRNNYTKYISSYIENTLYPDLNIDYKTVIINFDLSTTYKLFLVKDSVSNKKNIYLECREYFSDIDCNFKSDSNIQP